MNINLKKRNLTNLRRLVNVDSTNTPTGEECVVLVEECNDNVIEEGTPITEEVLEKINWRDESVIFKNLETNTLPDALGDQTQIVGLLDGSVWIIPKQGLGNAFKIENTSSFVTSIKEEEVTTYKNYKTGIKVTNGLLEVLNAKQAKKDAGGDYHGDKGVVTVIAENGLKINDGIIKVNTCSSVTSDSETKHGTVQVIQGNGLKLNNGTIKMNKVDSTNAGAIPADDYKAFKGFSEGISVTNLNEATTNGLYYGTNVSFAPTTNPIVCNVIKNNSIITQTLVDQITNKIWVRTINNGIIGEWTRVSGSKVLYDGSHTLSAETRLNTGVQLYQAGYRRIKIEVYEDATSETGGYNDYSYKNHASIEIPLFEEPETNYEGYENRFSFFTNITLSLKYWIKGNVKEDSVYLCAFSSSFTATGNENDYIDSSTNYHIRITGYKE